MGEPEAVDSAAEMTGEPGQPGTDPPQQLPGGLAGERQAEHLSRIGVAIGDQPDHPGGHGLGLAGPGSGHHHQRAGRGGDHRGLLVGGGRNTQGGSKFSGAVARAGAHDGSGAWAGQDGRSGQCEQPSLTRATNCGPAVAAAATCTACCQSAVASGPSAVCSRSVAPVADGLADVDQPAAPGPVTIVQQARGHRELVQPELGVVLSVILADRTLGGLDVDDHQSALRVALKPVDAAAHPHRRQPIGRPGDDPVEGDLGPDLGELMATGRMPRDECGQHAAVALEFVGGIPGRVEG